jgi:hypothetical protein
MGIHGTSSKIGGVRCTASAVCKAIDEVGIADL